MKKVFSSICSAILELEGLNVKVFDISSEYLSLFNLKEEFGLIIMSYPICCSIIKDIQDSNLPIIVLTDHINREVINLLEIYLCHIVWSNHSITKNLDY